MLTHHLLCVRLEVILAPFFVNVAVIPPTGSMVRKPPVTLRKGCDDAAMGAATPLEGRLRPAVPTGAMRCDGDEPAREWEACVPPAPATLEQASARLAETANDVTRMDLMADMGVRILSVTSVCCKPLFTTLRMSR